MANCTAPKPAPPPKTILEFLDRIGGERCGKPATIASAMGPRCQECYDKLKADTDAGRNLLGILRQVSKERLH